MSRPTSTRDRPTDLAREAARLSGSVAGSLGQAVRAGRQRMRITERELSARVGVDQTRISQIELGRGGGTPLSLLIAIGIALDQPLAVSFTRPLGCNAQPIDAGHLEMQEYLLGLARSTGRSATFELPTRPADPSRSIDVGVRDARHRVLIVEEAWNTFGDLGAAIRATHEGGRGRRTWLRRSTMARHTGSRPCGSCAPPLPTARSSGGTQKSLQAPSRDPRGDGPWL